METAELRTIAEYCRAHWPDVCQKTIETADRVCENRFLFDMPWDLERTEQEVAFGAQVDWGYTLNGDKEFVYQLNRHGFLLHLGQAYRFTGNEKYAKQFCSLLADWIDRVPCDYPGSGSWRGAWRTLETGIRAVNWIKAAAYVSDTKYFNETLKNKFEKTLATHAEVLTHAHEAFQKGSNWGVIQDGGLFQLGAYFGQADTIHTALVRLDEETDLQIMSDGVHWEQSSGYHNAVLVVLLEVLLTAKQKGIPLPAGFCDKVEKMALVNLQWLKPNGHHPLFGDSDDNDIRDILSRSALLFNRGDFKYCAFPCLDYDTAWLTGSRGIDAYAEIEAKEPSACNAYLADSGNYILKENHSPSANYLCFHNGYTGGGHAHADKLHFDLMIRGRDVLVDGGRYTYLYNKQRQYLKGAKGHNVCLIDNKAFLQMTDQWGVKNPAPAVQSPCFDNPYCTLIGGGHLGYLHRRSTYIERQILHIKPDIYIVLDFAKTALFHTYQQYFHFAPTGNVCLYADRAEFDDGEIKAALHFVSPRRKLTKMETIYSPNYNAICKNETVKASFGGFGSTCAVTVIYGKEKEHFKLFSVSPVPAKKASNGHTLSASQAQGIVIKTPETEYTVCLAFEELKTPFVCNGKIATGIINVFDGEKRIFKKW